MHRIHRYFVPSVLVAVLVGPGCESKQPSEDSGTGGSDSSTGVADEGPDDSSGGSTSTGIDPSESSSSTGIDDSSESSSSTGLDDTGPQSEACACVVPDPGSGMEELCTFEGTDCGDWLLCEAQHEASCTTPEEANALVEQCVAELLGSGGPGRFMATKNIGAGFEERDTTVIVLEDGTTLSWTEYAEDLNAGLTSAVWRNPPEAGAIEACMGQGAELMDCWIAAIEAVEPNEVCTEPVEWFLGL